VFSDIDGVEVCGGDGSPGAAFSLDPSAGIFGACLFIERSSFTEDFDVLSKMLLDWGDPSDGTVSVCFVVPASERKRPLTCLVEIFEAVWREAFALRTGTGHLAATLLTY